MANEFFLKKGDRLPVLESTLSVTTGIVDLTDATGVYFVYKPRFTGSASTVQGTFLTPKTGGKVQYAWTTGDTASIGPYWGEWRVWFTGKIQTFPSDGFISFEIVSGLI